MFYNYEQLNSLNYFALYSLFIVKFIKLEAQNLNTGIKQLYTASPVVSQV